VLVVWRERKPILYSLRSKSASGSSDPRSGACCQTTEHEPDHGQAHEDRRLTGVPLVVTRKPTAATDPGRGSLDNPSLREHHTSCFGKRLVSSSVVARGGSAFRAPRRPPIAVQTGLLTISGRRVLEPPLEAALPTKSSRKGPFRRVDTPIGSMRPIFCRSPSPARRGILLSLVSHPQNPSRQPDRTHQVI
jgi:hypothetical protein